MFNSFNIQNDPLLTFQSASGSKKYLLQCYKKQRIDKADQIAYDNCYRFMYYLEHGTLFFQQSQSAPLAIQPVLAFYGLSHLIKACLLTIDPHYPASVHVLAHGLSSRKRKKQNYHFFKDEIKIQRNGLMSYFSEQMFHVEQLEATKWNMELLLKQIPELAELFSTYCGHFPFLPLEKTDEVNLYSLSTQILDDYKMTDSRLADYLREKTKQKVTIAYVKDKQLFIRFEDNQKTAPCRYHLEKQQMMFSRYKSNEAFYPELMIYYGLLYNLSMIARYETEWWYELLKMTPGEEYPFIKHFLNISIYKTPLLIAEFLKDHHNY